MAAPPDLFLSYSRTDRARAQFFADGFAGAGLNVWWDTTLRAGEAYDQVTERALREARAVVVLWSQTSVESRWVRAEATQAQRLGRLVPCLIEPCQLPVMFELTQTADLAHWRGDADDPAWRGFLADVLRFIEQSPVTAAAPLAAGTRAVASPTAALLAVLPFDNLSSDPELAYFSDGVSEEILGRLSRSTKLPVIARTSSFQFRGPDKARAATALKASHILDGAIRRAGDRVRITAHLVDAARQTTLWSERYDRSLADVFAVQDEIAEAIATALNSGFFGRPAEVVDPATYDLYLRARVWVAGADEVREKIAVLEQVTRAAPHFATGWGRLAFLRSYLYRLLPLAERSAVKAAAANAMARALALDPDLVDGWAAQVGLLDPFGDFLAEAAIISRLVAIGANSAEAQFFIWAHLARQGRQREAADVAVRAAALDPLNPLVFPVPGYNHWYRGELDAARAVLEQSIARFPDNQNCAAALVLIYAHQGDWAAADHLLNPARLEKFPLREQGAVVNLARIMRHPTPENRRLNTSFVTDHVDRTGHLDPSWLLPMGYFGEVDEAYALLDRARLGPAGALGGNRGPYAYDPMRLFEGAWPQLRNDARFVKLCARLGLVEYWLATGNWPDCADEVPYDFRRECERLRDWPKDRFGA